MLVVSSGGELGSAGGDGTLGRDDVLDDLGNSSSESIIDRAGVELGRGRKEKKERKRV